MCETVESILPKDIIDDILIAGQDQVLNIFTQESYTEEDVNSFVEQCRSFSIIRSWNLYKNSSMHVRILDRMYNEMKPLNKEFDKESHFDLDTRKQYIKKGLKFISEGKLAVVLLAGGQATRMRPGIVKGSIDIGLPSHKTLFQRQCEHILFLEREVKKEFRKDIHIPIYIMTSQFNKTKIRTAFEDNNYFKLLKDQITFFSQGSFPCFDENGNCIMREKYTIAMSPNGSGGLFPAVQHCHIIDEWRHNGIKYVHIFSNDNTAVHPADPFYIGYALSHKSDVCIQAVEKICPEEKLPVIGEYGNRPIIADYNEMNYRQTCKRDSEGELVFRYGFIMNSLLSIDFIVNQCYDNALPAYCHIVHKAIPYYDSILNRTIKPVSPNGFKMEYYLSDLFPFAKQFNVLVVSRNSYIPINNPSSKHVETIEKAVQLLCLDALKILKSYDVTVQSDKKTDYDMIEISPLVCYNGCNLDCMKGCTIKAPLLIVDQSEIDYKSNEIERISEHVVYLKDKKADYNCNIYVLI